MGYAGGTKKKPTYHSLGDHSEALQLDYDPSIITFAELLDLFWASHFPTERSWSRQYMTAVFFHDVAQRQRISETMEREAAALKREIRTLVLPADTFSIAEDYHQKHALQRDYDILTEFKRIYPDFRHIMNSTAAARVNGILGGYGRLSVHKDEIESYGLSAKARNCLMGYLKE